MSTPRTHLLSACVITALVMPGCALLSKGDQGAARFFSLERAPDRAGAVAAQATRARAAAPQLRLGRITGAPHLGERLVVRDSAYEISYHRDLRWTEPPQQYLERMLARVLFEQRRLRHVVAGPAPTLEVQLTALDELRVPRPLARVQLIARLHDRHLVLWEETLTVDRPIAKHDKGDGALATVEALGRAMRDAVDQLADRVLRQLEQGRSSSPDAGPR